MIIKNAILVLTGNQDFMVIVFSFLMMVSIVYAILAGWKYRK